MVRKRPGSRPAETARTSASAPCARSRSRLPGANGRSLLFRLEDKAQRTSCLDFRDDVSTSDGVGTHNVQRLPCARDRRYPVIRNEARRATMTAGSIVVFIHFRRGVSELPTTSNGWLEASERGISTALTMLKGQQLKLLRLSAACLPHLAPAPPPPPVSAVKRAKRNEAMTPYTRTQGDTYRSRGEGV